MKGAQAIDRIRQIEYGVRARVGTVSSCLRILVPLYGVLLALFLAGLALGHANGIEYRSSFVWLAFTLLLVFPVLPFRAGLAKARSMALRWQRMATMLAMAAIAIIWIAFCGVFALWIGITYPQESEKASGFLEVQVPIDSYTTYTMPKSAEAVWLVYRRYFDWDSEHEIRALEHMHGMAFEARDVSAEGMSRYSPVGNPGIVASVKVDAADLQDDYIDRLCAELFTEKSSELESEYYGILEHDSDGLLVGLVFEYDGAEDPEAFARFGSELISAALQNQQFEKERGYFWYRQKGSDRRLCVGFGGAIDWSGSQAESPDFYADWQHLYGEMERQGLFSPMAKVS